MGTEEKTLPSKNIYFKAGVTKWYISVREKLWKLKLKFKVNSGGTKIHNFATINIHKEYFYVFSYFNKKSFKHLKSLRIA